MENLAVTVDGGIVSTEGQQNNAYTDLKRQVKAQPDSAQQGARSPNQAKELVFAHWTQLDRLCKRRFPQSENLAHEGLLFVLENLQVNEWQRICTWEGSGRFLTFLTTLTSRLLTDFTRKRFGHIRMPKWLADKTDQIWSAAYRLLIVEQYPRHEVVNLLQTNQPSRERWFLEEVVSKIQSSCHTNTRASEPNVSIEHYSEPGSSHSTPEVELTIQDRDVLEALCKLLDEQDQSDRPTPIQRVQELMARLEPHVNLTQEDRMLLRLHFVDGIKMKDIVRLLNLKGDPYKRYHKILKALRSACRKAGLLDALWKE